MQQSEKRLLLILCAAVFLALNILAFHAFLNSRKRIVAEIVSMKTSLAEEKGWLEAGEAVKPAEMWVHAHPMPSMPADEASATLLKTERESAEKSGLKVTEENLLPGSESSLGSMVGVSVKLSGPFSGIVALLYAMQDPSAWRIIQKLTLRSDTQPPNVLADLEILQYYKTSPAGAASAPPPAETQ